MVLQWRKLMARRTDSKTLAPGVRLGWVLAPALVARQLVMAKQGTDLHTNSFCLHTLRQGGGQRWS